MKLLILATLLGLSLAQFDPNTKDGRTAIVHLFEWRWTDIAAECERYLGPNGFGGVQVFFKHIIVVNTAKSSFAVYNFFVLFCDL